MKKLAFIGSCVVALHAACAHDSEGTAPDSVTDAGASTDGSANDASTKSDASKDCSTAEAQLLMPVDKVATGDLTVLSDANGIKTLYVDASAGTGQDAATTPRLYVDLATGMRVAVTDKTAKTSSAWDLAIKGPILFTNDGDGGIGQGGSVFLEQDFNAVTSDSANGMALATESFFDANCNPNVDVTGAVRTSFDGWYDTDATTSMLEPKPGTWLVRSGTGKLFKVAFLSYYATPDGGPGVAQGRYTIAVGAL
jgi:hypothetical protein